MDDEKRKQKRLPLNSRARIGVVKDIDLAIELGNFILEKGTESFSTKEDREKIADFLSTLTDNKDDFFEIFDSIELGIINELKHKGKYDEDKYFGIWLMLYSILGTVVAIQATGHTSDVNQRFVTMERILKMREKKKKKRSSSDAALIEAIKAEQGVKEATKPFKEAGAILSAINLRLESGGFPPVKIDVVRRRLEKWPALLKNAENS